MIEVVVEPCEESNLRYVVYENGTRVSTAIVAELEYDTDRVYVHTLGTDLPYRRKGYARAILEALQRDYRAIALDVFRLNEDARALYESVGFWDAYPDDEDDIIRHYFWSAEGSDYDDD